MKSNNNTTKPVSKPDSHSIEDETTNEIMKEHISDISDVITEDDIRSVKVVTSNEGHIEAGVEETKLILEEEQITDEEKEEEHEEAKKVNSSWNVLGSS